MEKILLIGKRNSFFGNNGLHYYGTITRCAYRIWLLVNFLSSPRLWKVDQHSPSIELESNCPRLVEIV